MSRESRNDTSPVRLIWIRLAKSLKPGKYPVASLRLTQPSDKQRVGGECGSTDHGFSAPNRRPWSVLDDFAEDRPELLNRPGPSPVGSSAGHRECKPSAHPVCRYAAAGRWPR